MGTAGSPELGWAQQAPGACRARFSDVGADPEPAARGWQRSLAQWCKLRCAGRSARAWLRSTGTSAADGSAFPFAPQPSDGIAG